MRLGTAARLPAIQGSFCLACGFANTAKVGASFCRRQPGKGSRLLGAGAPGATTTCGEFRKYCL